MHLLHPFKHDPNAENIMLAVSLNDLSFIEEATDCYMSLIGKATEGADARVFYQKRYESIKNACKIITNWAYGFESGGDPD